MPLFQKLEFLGSYTANRVGLETGCYSLVVSLPQLGASQREAKADGERIAWMEKGIDEAKQEAKVAFLETSAVGDAKAKAEEDQARV